VLACSIAAFLAVASRSNLAMGVRHVLPVIPPLTILAARAFDVLWQQFPQEYAQAALFTVLGSVAVSAVGAGPDYLGYFNVLAGGRKGGHEISIYGEDWGQDRERFATLIKDRKLDPLYYDPQTAMRAQEMRFLGARYKTLRCGTKVSGAWVALHALTYRTHDVARCYPYLKGREPDLNVNDHILIWNVPKTTPNGPDPVRREPEKLDQPPDER
jgi:hypothetical protein